MEASSWIFNLQVERSSRFTFRFVFLLVEVILLQASVHGLTGRNLPASFVEQVSKRGDIRAAILGCQMASMFTVTASFEEVSQLVMVVMVL